MEAKDSETSSLLRRWHAGDREALDALLVAHLPAIREYVERRLGPELRAKETVSDIAQEAVMEVLRYGPKFRVSDSRHFRLLMARVVENVLRDKNDWYRAQRRDRARERPLSPDSVIELDGPVKRPVPLEKAAEDDEQEAFVRLGLEILEPRYREVLVLRLWEGLSHAAVGQRLGVSPNAARKRFQRAMIHLEKIVRSLQRGGLGELLEREEAEP